MRTLIITLFLLNICSAKAQKTLRVMFLGNSYTGVNNLPQLIHDVTTSAGDSIIFSSYNPGGYTLENHYADSNSINLIHQGNWDYIVLQEQSQLPSYEDYLSGGPYSLSHEFSKYNPCGRVMFYMTWGRKNGDAGNCPVWPPVCTYEGMDSMLSLHYFETAQQTKAELSPVGKVWHRIRQLYPNIDLYQADESHPSEAGSYAAACCFYAALFKEDPNQITFDYTLPPGDAAVIRQVAKEVVFDSLSNYNFTQHNPIASFHYVVTGNNEITFYNWPAYVNAETFLWQFGDGDTSTLPNPVHTFVNDGQYQVTLHSLVCDLDSTYDSTFQVTVSFCSYNPTIFPDTAILCPNFSDTLFTQVYDSYQWIGEFGDTIPGETNNYMIPPYGGEFHVITTLNGCHEMSQPKYVISYFTNLIIYNADTSLFPDTICMGDTIQMVIYPNKPDHSFFTRQWLRDGIPLSYTGDTLLITTSGTYQVRVLNPVCQNYNVFVSDTFPVSFLNCNNSIAEIDNNAFEIYPQPVKDFIFIKSRNKFAGEYNILDIFGRKLSGGTINNEITINMSALPQGTYFLKCGSITKKILKL
jgi:hypothetical protein